MMTAGFRLRSARARLNENASLSFFLPHQSRRIAQRQTKNDAGAIKKSRREQRDVKPSGVVSSPEEALSCRRGPPPRPRSCRREMVRRCSERYFWAVPVGVSRSFDLSPRALRPEQQVAGVLVTAQSVTVSSFGSRSARLPASSSLPGVASRNARAPVRQVGRHLSTRSNRPRRPSARWSRDASGGPCEPPPSVCGRAAPTPGSPGTGPHARWPARPGWESAS
ncbi:hypothetical protein MTO96_011811 [Rhipicephalus appendiculatus]